MNGVHIIIFAKAPEPFRAKTRLIPALGADGAAELARKMLHHALHEALAVGADTVELCMAPAPADVAWQGVALPDSVMGSDQGAGSLGDRLARASARALDSGKTVLLMGTDCPALDALMLRRAAQALEQVDTVVIPATDGGYVLLGLKRFDASLFEGIAWSTSSVYETTAAKIASMGWTLKSFPPVPDIDEPADLKHLPEDWL